MPEPELQTETTAQDQQAIRQSVRELCRDFPDTYWRKVDKAEEYPEAFVNAVTKIRVPGRAHSRGIWRRWDGYH